MTNEEEKIFPHSIYSQEYQSSLKNTLKFELISLIGRILFNKKPPIEQNGINLLNLGCGKNYFTEFVNADFFHIAKFNLKRILFFQKPKKLAYLDWRLDLRYPLNCPDNCWDGIFSEHCIEHLEPLAVMRLLKELNRTLKPKAWIRITVPDLEQYVNYYIDKECNENFKKWHFGAEAILSLTKNWGHNSVWDYKILEEFLQKAGFINIKKVEFNKGSDPRLLKDWDLRSWETLYVEAQKA